MIAVVAVLGVVTLAVLVAWGLRVINDIEDLENLSSRVVGPAGEIRAAWSAVDKAPVARNVRIHPAAMTSSLSGPGPRRAAS